MVDEVANIAHHFLAVTAEQGPVLLPACGEKTCSLLLQAFVAFECLENTLQPSLVFEVHHSRVVPQECGVVKEMDGHRFKILQREFGDVDEILIWKGIFSK